MLDNFFTAYLLGTSTGGTALVLIVWARARR